MGTDPDGNSVDGVKPSRTHDWALLDANERVCDFTFADGKLTLRKSGGESDAFLVTFENR